MRIQKEFVVLQISAVQDGTPGVTLSMLDEGVLRARGDKKSPYFGLGLAYLLRSRVGACVSLSLDEYASSGIRVGDRVSVGVTRLKENRRDLQRNYPRIKAQAETQRDESTKEGL